MKKNVIICWILIVCLSIIGCGGKNRQNVIQDKQLEVQNIQTKWDGDKEDNQEKQMEKLSGSEKSQEDIDKTERVKVSFLGSENSFIETCRIYHGKEQIDIVPDEIESFIQMLSEYIMDAKDSWMYVLGLMDLKDIEDLRDMAGEEKAKYYILLQFTKPVDTVFEFGSECGKTETMQLNGNLYIFEIDESEGDFMMYYESGIDKLISLNPIGDIDRLDKVEDFLQRYEKWMVN